MMLEVAAKSRLPRSIPYKKLVTSDIVTLRSTKAGGTGRVQSFNELGDISLKCLYRHIRLGVHTLHQGRTIPIKKVRSFVEEGHQLACDCTLPESI